MPQFQDPQWLDRTEYPFAPHVFDTPHGRMHYVDEGAGAPIVLVHGVPTWSFLFRRIIAGLARRYRCVAPDLLGFGLSDKPAQFDYDPAVLARYVGDLIDSLNLEHITLVVHDWGGPLALPYAYRRPGNVARLVISNSWLWPAAGDRRAATLAALFDTDVFARLERKFGLTSRSFLALAVGDRHALTPAIRRQYSAPLEAPEDRSGVIALARAIKRAEPWLAVQWQQSSLLRELPALILWGMRDVVFTRRDLDRWRGLFRAPEVHRLERVGHFVPEEASDICVHAIDAFMSVHDRPPQDAPSGGRT